MRDTLPDSIPESLEILTQSLPVPLVDCASITDGWLQWPIGQFIADYGLPYVDESFAAMIALTQRLTSEYAIRPFVDHDHADCIRRLTPLVSHPSPHVRRWCSEGVRTRLPWGIKLHKLINDPEPVWHILEALKCDSEQYVLN